ncbi:hypothetical protein VTI74DRAFT_6558 [Chaetomium olivicolor]
MRSIVVSVRDAEPQLPFDEDASPASDSVAWIVLAIVGGVMALGGILTLVLVSGSRRRQYRKERRLYPYLTRDEFLRHRKLSATHLLQEEEERRRHMIRKSLASRSTASAGSRYSALVGQMDQELMAMERQESLRLKDDWKRWEARERRERSMSGGQHPAVIQVPILAIPSPAKHRSQPSTWRPPPPYVPTTPPTPPLPPRHPRRQSADRAASFERLP